MAHGQASIGVMFNTDRMSGRALRDFAAEIETLGVSTLWLPELFGREPFSAAGYVLASTNELKVATGIANVYARDAVAAAAGARTLTEFSGGRFILGLGVSNAGLVQARGHQWEPPVKKLGDYVAAVRSAEIAVPGDRELEIHVAAHGPKMLAALADSVDGVSTFLQTPEHTAQTRKQIAATTALNVTLMCLPSQDPQEARALG